MFVGVVQTSFCVVEVLKQFRIIRPPLPTDTFPQILQPLSVSFYFHHSSPTISMLAGDPQNGHGHSM